MKHKEQLRHCVIIYNNWISKNIDHPVKKALIYRPEELESIFNDLKDLMTIIADANSTIDILSSKQLAYLKSAILYSLYTKKEDVKKRSKLTSNKEILKTLAQEVEEILKLTEVEWFRKSKTFETPRLEQYLVVQKHGLKNTTETLGDNVPMFEFKPSYHGLSINLGVILSKIKSFFKR